MNAFWKWLMKTNARLVFVCALVALMVAAGYWAWQLLTPVDVEPMLPVSLKKKVKTDLGLLAFVDRQLSPDLYKLPGNSFLTPGTPEREYVRSVVPVPAVTNRPPKPIPIRPPDPPPIVKPTPPGPPPVKLTYKGIYRASDGTEMAWIEDSQSNGKSFYDIGATIFGATIESITTTEAHITLPNGSSLELKFGKPQTILD